MDVMSQDQQRQALAKLIRTLSRNLQRTPEEIMAAAELPKTEREICRKILGNSRKK